ncbi:MAG: hypothetical protein R3C52_06470 [Hyphomonadaceae bacterium]
MTFLALQIVAVVNVVVSSVFAFWALTDPRRLGPAKTGKRGTQSTRTLAYFGAMRTLILAAATVAAIALGARQGFLWLAGVGAVILLFDSLPGQARRDPAWALIPLGVGVVQVILLAVVVNGLVGGAD